MDVMWIWDGLGNVKTIEYDFSVLMDAMDSDRKF